MKNIENPGVMIDCTVLMSLTMYHEVMHFCELRDSSKEIAPTQNICQLLCR